MVSTETGKWNLIIENLLKTVSSVPSEEDLGMSAFHDVPVVCNEISMKQPMKRTLAYK